MQSTTYVHPNLVAFWNLLAYPKWLVKTALLLLLLISIPAYIVSRPEMFVEHHATITGIEFRRATSMKYSDYLIINYQYIYKNKVFDSWDSHSLPWHYPDEKIGEYVSKFNQMYPNGSTIKIIVNEWRVNFSSFSKLSEFKGSYHLWFLGAFLYFFMYYWLLPMLVLTSASMLFKHFFMRDEDDE